MQKITMFANKKILNIFFGVYMTYVTTFENKNIFRESTFKELAYTKKANARVPPFIPVIGPILQSLFWLDQGGSGCNFIVKKCIIQN